MAKTSEKNSKNEKKVKDILKVPAEFYYGTGRRKNAIAKVWLFEGSGKVSINKKDPLEYLKTELLTGLIFKPLKDLKLDGKYDVLVKTIGGGLVGQAGAIQLGIARSILTLNPSFRNQLKESGFLTRDPRVKERKKYGRKKARKGFQFRKR